MKRILIHIPKTGGNCIQRCARLKDTLVKFGPHEMPPEYVAGLRKHFDSYGLNYQFEHCRWRDLSPEFTGKHGAVAMVRNPWSKVVSSYRFALKIAREHPSTNTAAVPGDATFADFLELRHRWRDEPYFWHRTTVGWYPQVDHLTDDIGRLRCDVLRFEHHAADCMAYFGLDKPIESRNVTGAAIDYREFYTAETRDVIGDWFAKDVEFFGFTFEGTATRNTWA